MSDFFTIYKTTNLINGKIYIGKHQTKKIDDAYLGSGVSLIQAIKKYGKENFKKEILFVYDNEKDMNLKEIELVNESFIKRKDTYNHAIGGEGGSLKGKQVSDYFRMRVGESRRGKKFTKSKDALENEKRLRYERNNGKYFSEETIQKIRQKALMRGRAVW
jgi:hypothetical protein